MQPISFFLTRDQHTCLIAQTIPFFGKVSLRNKCILTCDEQKDGLGGILAFRARSLSIDKTSKIDMSGKGNYMTHDHELNFFLKALNVDCQTLLKTNFLIVGNLNY